MAAHYSVDSIGFILLYIISILVSTIHSTQLVGVLLFLFLDDACQINN